jgi:hypothetical protein
LLEGGKDMVWRGLVGLVIVAVLFSVFELSCREKEHANSPQRTKERVTSIVENPSGTFYSDCYVFAGGGCSVASVNGKVPVTVVDGQTALKIEVTGSSGYWGIGLARRGWVRWYLDDYLPDGVMEFQVRGERGGERFRIGFADSDRDGQGPDTDISAYVSVAKYVTVSREWQTVRIPITDFVSAEPRIELDDCQKVVLANEGEAKPMTVYLRGIKFVTTSPERPVPPIKVNQLGYRPHMIKIAKISAPAKTFRVVDASTGRTVYQGVARKVAENDPISGDDVWEADFTPVKRPGRYKLVVDGVGESFAFEIRDDIYDNLFRDAVRFYYLQRCGIALEPKYAGPFAREACHLGDKKALTREGEFVGDVSGGWHDAGDCNKYAPWVRYHLFMMLDIYDLRPRAFRDGQLNIPESGNGVPDLLDEAKWELDWLLKMQITSGEQAGLVYDRIHESAAPRDRKYPRLQEERRLLPPTHEATAVCASVWARAAKTFTTIPKLRDSANRYLAAAELAWRKLVSDNARPEFLFIAAACLYDTTGKEEYRKAVLELMDKVLGNDPSGATERFIWEIWDCAVITLALSKRDGLIRDKARAFLKATVDRCVETWRKDAYSVPIWNPDHYCWSSNQIIGKRGYYAIMAHQFAPNPEYLQMAADTLHYLLGRNAVCYIMVTGYGTRVTEIFHSIYGKSAMAWLPTPPGFVPGGVNQWESRGISAFPAKNFRPDPNNWTLTEPAIYYNAPLVFLAGYFARLGDPSWRP